LLILGPILTNLTFWDFWYFSFLFSWSFGGGYGLWEPWKRSGRKFRFWGLQENLKIIIPNIFHEEKVG